MSQLSNKIHKAHLTEGPIGRKLLELTLPMMLAMVSMVAFNLVDTYFIGRLGTEALAAISFTFPVVFIIAGISMGLGIGASAAISKAIGEGDSVKVKHLTSASLILAVLAVLVFVIIGLLSLDKIFQLMGATEDVLPLIRQYMRIWIPGVLFVVIPMVGNNCIRATGDTRTPAAIMLTAVAINAVLDPLLIFGIGPFPRLGLAGAAVATVGARVVTMMASLYVLSAKKQMLGFKGISFSEILTAWRQILYVGLPTSGSNIIVPAGIAVITRMVAAYGHDAVAGFGVASRIESFALMVIMALASVTGPFIGQNLGAGKVNRIKQGLYTGQRFSMFWGAGVMTLFFILAKPIASLFTNDPAVIQTTVLYLRIVPLGYGLQGVMMLSNGALNVLNRPLVASLLIVSHVFVLFIPLAMLGSHLIGLAGIMGAGTLARLLVGTAAFFWVRKVILNLDIPITPKAS